MMETKVIYNEEDEAVKTTLLQHYSGRCHWLKDQRFLRELEGDSVDTEILDEELRSIQDEEPKTCRGKTLKVLDSNPFQIVLCVLVLVDAGVVIAEILLDLHAIRSQLVDTEHTMAMASQYLNASYSQDLYGSDLESLDDILHVLRFKYGDNMTEIKSYVNCDSSEPPFASATEQQPTKESKRYRRNAANLRHHSGESLRNNKGVGVNKNHTNTDVQISIQAQTANINSVPIMSDNMQVKDSSKGESTSSNDVISESQTSGGVYPSREFYRSKSMSLQHSNTSVKKYPKKKKKYTYAEKLLKIAHILHYCSIAILGLFVFQVIVKMYGMGLEFFRQKLEVFDAVIISASFALDLVFLNGIGGAQGEEAAALLIVFLLWRLLRVINGLMVTEKKRQEFRLKLQKRARRKAEKRVEVLEEEKRLKEKEIDAIKELCKHKGASDVEITNCRPRRVKSLFHKMDTSAGLSSIAALSLGFGMSMSSSRIVHSPAMPRTPSKPTPPKSGEIQLHNIMVGVGLYNETATPAKTPKKYLSVPRYKKRPSPTSSPRGSPKSSRSCSPTEKNSLTFPRSCQSSPEIIPEDGMDSSCENVTRNNDNSKNGNIVMIEEDNQNQNNSHHSQSSECANDLKLVVQNQNNTDECNSTLLNSSPIEQITNLPQCKNTVHIIGSSSVHDSRQLKKGDLSHNKNKSNGSHGTQNVNKGKGNNEVGQPLVDINTSSDSNNRPIVHSNTSKDEISSGNNSSDKQSEPCKAKRAIFATKSHPYVIKNNLPILKQKPTSLDIDPCGSRSNPDGVLVNKDCLSNGRINNNSAHSKEVSPSPTCSQTRESSAEVPTFKMVCEDSSL